MLMLVILGFPFGKLSLGQTQIFLYTCKAENIYIYINKNIYSNINPPAPTPQKCVKCSFRRFKAIGLNLLWIWPSLSMLCDKRPWVIGHTHLTNHPWFKMSSCSWVVKCLIVLFLTADLRHICLCYNWRLHRHNQRQHPVSREGNTGSHCRL